MPKSTPKRVFLLNVGPIKYPHTDMECETHFERTCQMWGLRLCAIRETAWYNDPCDPGVVSNDRFTAEGFSKLPQEYKSRILKIIIEENQMFLNCQAESNSLVESVERLIKIINRQMFRMTVPEQLYVQRAIWDAREWAKERG